MPFDFKLPRLKITRVGVFVSLRWFIITGLVLAAHAFAQNSPPAGGSGGDQPGKDQPGKPASNQPGPSQPNLSQPSQSNAVPENQATLSQIDASKVPDPEKLKISAEAVTVMRAALRDVLQKLEEARNTKDVVKLTCVNEKLIQIKALLRIAEQSDVALQEAVARRETQNTDREFTKITIARSRVDQLRAEVEQCMGQLAFRADENATIEVETPDYLPKGDPSQIGSVPRTVDSRPVPASPTGT
jgi:hypothetical protein